MEISGEQRIEAPRERVWEALNDPEVLKACILGCEELEKLSDTEMKSVVVAKFGPIKAKFKADISIEDIDATKSCKLVGNGQGGMAGFAKGEAKINLTDDNESGGSADGSADGESTLLQYQVDFSVGGKIAQIGSRLLKGTTTKIVDHFFDTFKEKLGSGL